MTLPMTILLVEDELLVRMNMADEFSDLGFVVLDAGNAHDAMAMLGGGSEVDVLFTDVDMPGRMDGLTLAQVVSESWPLIKIIVTSGHRNVLTDDMPLNSRFFGKPYAVSAVASAMLEMTA